MPELKEDELRVALSGLRDARRKKLALRRQPDLLDRSRKVSMQRSHAEKTVESILTSSGIRTEDLEKLRSGTHAAMQALLKEQRAAAIGRASTAKDFLQAEADKWRNANQRLAALNFNIAVIDVPAFIFSSDGLTLSGTSIAPWNNVAKISGEWYEADTLIDEDLSFIFAWGNPSDQYAVVNVETYIALNGQCAAWADGGFSGYSTESVVDVGLEILEYWNKPPTSPTWQPSQFINAVDLWAHSWWWADYERITVQLTNDVLYRQFVLPPRGVAIFIPNVGIQHWTDSGFTTIDFASGDFEVKCPAVVIGILS